MADTAVLITFGAKIDDLVKGINDVKTHLTELQSKFAEVKTNTESISHGIDGLSSGLKAFAATLLAAFSIEGIENFVSSMANLGSKMENIKYTMGLSAQSVVELAGVAKITGTSIDTLTGGIERMAINIQRATRDSTNPFNQALKNLGLSTKDFIGLNGAQYFEKLSAAVSKFNPDMNLTTNLMQLGGRNFRDMIPALMQGEEAFKKYGASIRAATEGLAAGQPGMEETHSKLVMLSLSVEGLRARIFNALKPAIDAVVESLTRWVQSIDTATIIGAAQTVANALVSILEALGNFVIRIMDLMNQVEDRFRRFAATGSQITANLEYIFSGKGAPKKSEAYEEADRLMAEGNAKIEERRKQLAEIVSKFKATMDGLLQTMNPSQEAATKPPVGGGAKAPALQFPGSGGEALSAAQRQIAIIDQQYQMEVEKINHAFKMSVDVFGSAENEKTQALLSALNTRLTAELSVLEQVQAKYGAGSKEYQRIEDEKTKIIQKAALERLRIENQAAEASWQKWKSASSDISGAFSSHLREMFTGTMTFSQAVGRTLGDLIVKWSGDLVKMAVEWVAKQLWMSMTGKAIQATDVAAHTTAEGAKTAATTAGVTARAGAEATGAATNIFAQIGQAISFIFTQAAKTFAGVFAFLSPVMGPAAAGPAAESSGEVIAVAGSIGAFDKGTDYVSRAGLAFVHKDEQIVPAAQAKAGYTGANSGTNNVNVTIAISAIDAGGFAQWLKKGGANQIAAAVSPVMTRNMSLRPAY